MILNKIANTDLLQRSNKSLLHINSPLLGNLWPHKRKKLLMRIIRSNYRANQSLFRINSLLLSNLWPQKRKNLLMRILRSNYGANRSLFRINSLHLSNLWPKERIILLMRFEILLNYNLYQLLLMLTAKANRATGSPKGERQIFSNTNMKCVVFISKHFSNKFYFKFLLLLS